MARVPSGLGVGDVRGRNLDRAVGGDVGAIGGACRELLVGLLALHRLDKTLGGQGECGRDTG